MRLAAAYPVEELLVLEPQFVALLLQSQTGLLLLILLGVEELLLLPVQPPDAGLQLHHLTTITPQDVTVSG